MNCFAATLVQSGLNERVKSLCSLYQKSGLVSADGMVTGEDGTKYPFPTADLLADLLNRGWPNRYEPKILQNFHKVQIIPGIVGQQRLLSAVEKTAKSHSHRLVTALGSKASPNWANLFDCDYDMENLEYRKGTEWLDRKTFYTQQPCPGYQVVLTPPLEDTWSAYTTPLEAQTLLGTGKYQFEEALSLDGMLACWIESMHTQHVIPDIFFDERSPVRSCPDNLVRFFDNGQVAAPSIHYRIETRQIVLGYQWFDREEHYRNIRRAVRVI